MKKALSVLLVLSVLLSCFPFATAASEESPTVILFGSDYQNNCYDPGYNRFLYDDVPLDEQPRTVSLNALLNSVAAQGIVPDAALFAGDYTDHFQDDGNGAHCANEGIAKISSMLDDIFGEGYCQEHDVLFAQGNHDYEGTEGLAESGLQSYDDEDAYLVYVINEKDFPYSQSSGDQATISSTAQDLGVCMRELVAAGELRPIIILCHVPLHYSTRYNGGDNPYASLIFNELNDAAQELNVFFLFGHNHSGASADYEAAWGGAVNYVARGQKLDVNCPNHNSLGSNEQTIHFTYLNAGYIGYSNSVTNDTRVLSLLTVYDNRVVLSRYDASGEYTNWESLGQTNPLKPEEGAVTQYPITIPLHSNSPYTISALSSNELYGSVTASDNHVVATAKEDYGVSGWTLEPQDGATVTQIGDEFYFSDLSADCVLTVHFEEVRCVSEPFTDVDQGLWYHDSVDFAIRNGMFGGISETEFDPDGTMTRAMLVTVLYRFDGSCAIAPGDYYSDVPIDSWYSAAVTWGKVTNIALGVGDGLFAPDDYVTREQVATMLYRYAKQNGYPVSSSANADISSFTDSEAISEYALPAIRWGVDTGLLGGVGGNLLDPQGSATRAQVATILMRFSLLLNP
ncbi:MAG: S-layer homology domain-containing protein [Oscillospiraceae bacterium]|nr:S-layer homology domain-containing protein [Oscillospiraceae bacterium]